MYYKKLATAKESSCAAFLNHVGKLLQRNFVNNKFCQPMTTQIALSSNKKKNCTFKMYTKEPDVIKVLLIKKITAS